MIILGVLAALSEGLFIPLVQDQIGTKTAGSAGRLADVPGHSIRAPSSLDRQHFAVQRQLTRSSRIILATPLALSWLWAFVCAVLLCGIIAARLLDEERYLSKNLPDKAWLPHQGWLPPLDEPGVLCPCSPRQKSQTSAQRNYQMSRRMPRPRLRHT
jgi:hypothetical protein